MDKKMFFKLFKDCDEYILSSLWEDILLAIDIEVPIFTKEFFPPSIWNTLENLSINGIKFLTKGLNEESEKRVVLIYPKDYDISYLDFPVCYFKIDGKNKFKELYHKDFLGTIMSTGLRREFLGDLIVKNSVCFGVIMEEKYGIIEEKMEKIGNTPVKIEKISEEDIPKGEFKEEKYLVASLRIDNLISAVSGLSRQKSVEEIEKGNVLLNYNIQRDKSREIKEGDILTIKKIGKFRFEQVIGESKKNKLRISIKRFI